MEFIGVVVSAPARPDLEGCRVVADINCGCGKCNTCKAGDYRHCKDRTAIGILGRNGVFADFCVIPAANLYVVPGGIEDEYAVFAEPLAAALAVVHSAEITEQSRVAVLGDGENGSLMRAVFAAGNLRSGPDRPVSEKLQIAQRQGVHTICRRNGSSDEIPEDIRSHGYDVVIEATGNPDGINDALCLVRSRGNRDRQNNIIRKIRH